ncbi:MAG: Lrp/AsnC family transcriptional regulator [Burkholderiales bacterium]|nr:Lrp/AsnC family transcriptional regulator [Burkholderiales bacterium]
MPKLAAPKMNELEFRLLNGFQRGFPLHPRPFQSIATQCGVAEAQVLERLRALSAGGSVSRVGAVFAPGRIGASTLFALAVPRPRLEAVAAMLDAFDGINHNYEREHAFNLWAVATAPRPAALQALLDRIRADTGVPLLDLPLLEEYRIDLGFDLDGAERSDVAAPLNGAAHTLSERERRLVAALQEGLALVPMPYRALAARASTSESDVLDTLTRWLASGVVRRFGVVVRHHELGYRANAMAVWDVPDAAASGLGKRLAAEAGVTLAYRRRRALPDWRYNLFCMVHGKQRDPVRARIEEIARDCGLDRLPHAVLFSRRRFKQSGARYVYPEAAHG